MLKRLAAMTLVNSFGNGMFFTVSALLFTRVIGLSAAQIGLGLGVAGIFGIIAGVPCGRLADRYGARRVLMALLAVESVVILGYTQVSGFAAFVSVACVVAFVDRGGAAVRHALIATSFTPGERTRGRAFLRVLINVGMGAGSAAAVLALLAEAYLHVVVINAVTFAVSALLLVRLPDPARAVVQRRRSAFADRPYLLITVLNAIIAMQAGVLEVGLPLWIVQSTNAPTTVVAVAVVLNTVMVILLQVRMSRGTEDPYKAARIYALAGLLMATACLVYGGAGGQSAIFATVALLVAVAVHTLAEILSAAGGWALSYELADQSRPGAYQGVFQSGYSAGMALAPALVAMTALEHGLLGWAALGTIFAAAGLAMIPATRWAVTASAPTKS